VDLDRILSDLRQERAALEEAILVLERLGRGAGKRRGRPPKWLSEMMGPDHQSKAPAKRKSKQPQ
jgi:hypothetical protein